MNKFSCKLHGYIVYFYGWNREIVSLLLSCRTLGLFRTEMAWEIMASSNKLMKIMNEQSRIPDFMRGHWSCMIVMLFRQVHKSEYSLLRSRCVSSCQFPTYTAGPECQFHRSSIASLRPCPGPTVELWFLGSYPLLLCRLGRVCRSIALMYMSSLLEPRWGLEIHLNVSTVDL